MTRYRPTFFAGLAVIVVALATGVGLSILTDPEHARPPHARPADSGRASAPLPLAAVGGDSTAALEAEFVVFVEGIVREQERVAVEEAARVEAARRVGQSGAAAPRGGAPGACDGVEWVIPAQYVARESGCRFDAESPGSFCGGHGCVGAYQFDRRHWDAGSGWGGCADLGDWRDPEAQHECARRLSRDGTNLSPWGG